MSMEQPIPLSTPNQIASSGIAIAVTNVISRPQPLMISTRRYGCREKLSDIPETKINVMQINRSHATMPGSRGQPYCPS